MSENHSHAGLIVANLIGSLIITAGLVFIGLSVQQMPAASSAVSGDQLAVEINKGIEAYVQAEQQKAIDAQQAANQPQVPTGTVPPVTDSDHVRGNRNADIVLIEYSDFQCPYCKKFHPTAKQIIDNYGGKVSWVYRHLPLSFHEPDASKKAIASECVAEQGGDDAFWKFTDSMYADQTADITKTAVAAGVNQAKFQACLDSGKYDALIEQQKKDAAALGVNGTPGNIIYNVKTGESKMLPGAYPFESFKEIIDAMI